METKTSIKRSTFAILFYLNTSKPRKDGTCPIVGRITIDAKSVQFSTKINLSPSDWDTKKGRAKKERKELTQINKTLDRLEEQVKTHYSKIVEIEGYVTATNLLQLFQEHNEEFEKRVGVNRVYSTYCLYLSVYKHLSNFILSRYQTEDLPLVSLNHKFINDYDFYLRVERKMSAHTVLNHIIILKKMIRRSINQGTLKRNPFINFISETPQRLHRHLTEEEFQKILTTPVASYRYSRTRDWFVFSTFTGLSYADMCALSINNLIEEQDGSTWIKIPRQKTGTVCSIKLLSIPFQIIKKYEKERKSDKVFNMINRPSLAVNMKGLAKICGIERDLTYHMSRHTYGTLIGVSQGVPIETVCKLMGHRSIQTTQIYAKITNQKVNEDMKQLFIKIGDKYQLINDDKIEFSHNQFYK